MSRVIATDCYDDTSSHTEMRMSPEMTPRYEYKKAILYLYEYKGESIRQKGVFFHASHKTNFGFELMRRGEKSFRKLSKKSLFWYLDCLGVDFY